MTTKIRIITGFAVLLILLGVMAFLGYQGLQTASGNFDAYRRMARINVWASDLKSSIYETVYFTGLYLNEKKPESAREAIKRVESGIKIIDDILGRSQREETIVSVTKAKGIMADMRVNIENMQVKIEKVQSINRDVQQMVTQGATVLRQMAEAGKAAENIEALYWQSMTWSSLASVRANLLLFADSMTPETGQQMTAAIESGLKAVDDFGAAVSTAAGRRDHAAILDVFESFAKHAPLMLEAGAEAHALVEGLADKGRDVVQVVNALDASADEAMRENGETTRAGNEAAQARMLVTSLAGMLLGILFAAFTIITLVRTLGKMSRFAGDIANGRFESEIAITEKGEIGAMFQAMRRIPEIFSGVIERCDAIANVIASGLFRERLEPDQFNGGFRRLAESINAIADSYTRTIDTLPVGIASLDATMKTRFTNQAGLKMLGQDVLKAFNGAMPLLEACMRENRVTAGETGLTSPEGVALQAAATSMPLRDLQGKAVGGLGVFTDITEIKEKQRIMLEVATQASTIADRVAAASEELAAQVEEVSRGAEVQRSRVESTASAMSEMNSTVIEVARNAGQASDQSERTRDNASNGAELVNKVVSAINEVNTVAARLQQNMQSLGDQADSIGSVMNVISDIADQTNLLALNAAIEAARAGEAGRGFAVVADEVRKLAEKTMGATKEVGENISAIQDSAQTNIQEVGAVGKTVSAATQLANDSGNALKEIVELASATSNVVSSIAAAAEEQSAASEEITQAVDEINRLVGETTEGMIQSSSAVQDLSRTAQELRRVMEGLR